MSPVWRPAACRLCEHRRRGGLAPIAPAEGVQLSTGTQRQHETERWTTDSRRERPRTPVAPPVLYATARVLDAARRHRTCVSRRDEPAPLARRARAGLGACGSTPPSVGPGEPAPRAGSVRGGCVGGARDLGALLHLGRGEATMPLAFSASLDARTSARLRWPAPVQGARCHTYRRRIIAVTIRRSRSESMCPSRTSRSTSGAYAILPIHGSKLMILRDAPEYAVA